MGLFSFVKNAGSKIFGKKEDSTPFNTPPVAKTDADAPRVSRVVSQEDIDSAKADQLIGLVQALGLKIDSLFVAVEDETATIAGTAESMAVKEKAVLAIGNVEGIAQVDDKLKVAGVVPEAQGSTVVTEVESTFHTVVGGDTLSKISKKYYDDPMKYMDIFEANQPMLKDPDLVYVGQVLRIPSLDA